jgi:tetratricopeptide (TPR) repeat protein
VSAHYDEAALYDYLDNPEAFARREELETHLAFCEVCRAALDELREFEAALSSTMLWDFADAARRRLPPDALRSIADLLAAEEADADRYLTPILASPAAFRRANIAAAPNFHSAGVVRKLCQISRELRERQPMHALMLADAAVSIAEQLPSDRYPSAVLEDLRGNAWLERANALRYLGRYPEALDGLDIAERAFTATPVAAYSIALVSYLRAALYVELDRFEEALRLARHAARVFRQFGEDERYVHAKMVEAGVLFHQNRYREALELFTGLTPATRKLGKAETLARLYNNVANCHLALEEFETASSFFGQALSLYEALGLETEKLRTRWSLGSLLVRGGTRVPEGIAKLRDAKAGFEQLGATTDAALVTLDLVEALLALNATREAADLCAGLVENFTHVGMTGSALTALAFLREAVAAGSATPILVRHVRHFIAQRPDVEGRPFVPLPE